MANKEGTKSLTLEQKMPGDTILCLSPRVWDSLWRSTQQIMSRLAKNYRILFIEPGRNPDRSSLSEMRRNWINLFSLDTAYQAMENVIAIPSPPRLPYMRQRLPRSALQVSTPVMARINMQAKVRRVHQVMEAFGVETPILWLHGLFDPAMVGKFNEKLACYFVYDETPDFVHNARISEFLRKQDYQMSARVDVVFASSRSQWERRNSVNPNTYFVPNGVDFDMFNRPLTSHLPLPPDIAPLPRPTIGYAGWMGYQMDTELLCLVARAYPDCSLVLVGPSDLPDSNDLGQLQSLPNVFFLGRKDRQELPNYLQAFDVALMPYLLKGHVLSIYPLKLHEYLAAGRAVVSTDLPELQPYGDQVRIAQTHDEFIDHIRDALGDDTPQAIEARVAVARENTWDHRVAEINRVLEQHLSVKSKELAA